MKEISIRMDDNTYGIDTSCVVEIVPLVELEPAAQHHADIAGAMRYRGEVLPVIDLCMLLMGRPHQKKFSTRILIVQVKAQTIGLIVESLTDLNSEQAEHAQKLDLPVLLAHCL